MVDLSLVGGQNRAYLIDVALVLGVAAFFGAYLRTNCSVVTWGFKDRESLSALPRRSWFLLLVVVVVGLASLASWRAGLVPVGGYAVSAGSGFERGRLIGTTGYVSAASVLLYVPAFMFLLSHDHRLRAVGFVLVAIFVILGSLATYGRFYQVSMLLGVVLAEAIRARTRLRPLAFFLAAAILASVLGLRGHTVFTSLNEAAGLVQQVGSNGVQPITQADALSNWYLTSYQSDHAGYEYGLPLANYVLTGYLPNQYFPWKYFLLDWLQQNRTGGSPVVQSLVDTGLAQGLFGTFYDEGGMAGLILLAFGFGYLGRRIDGMVLRDAPIVVQAAGITWLSMVWMLWGRGDTWGVNTLGYAVAPACLLWLLDRPTRRSLSPHPRLPLVSRDPNRPLSLNG